MKGVTKGQKPKPKPPTRPWKHTARTLNTRTATQQLGHAKTHTHAPHYWTPTSGREKGAPHERISCAARPRGSSPNAASTARDLGDAVAHKHADLELVGAQDGHRDALEDAAEADGIADLVREGHAAGGRGHLATRLLGRQLAERSVSRRRDKARRLDGHGAEAMLVDVVGAVVR